MYFARYMLGGGFNPLEKILVKLDHFPRVRGENKTCERNHHLVWVVINIMWLYIPDVPCREYLPNYNIRRKMAT